MPGVRIVSFLGDFDLVAKAQIERDLNVIEEFAARTVTIVDLTNTNYADSTMLNAIIDAHRLAAGYANGSSVCVVAPRGTLVRRLFDITNLSSFIDLFEDVETARRHVDVLARMN